MIFVCIFIVADLWNIDVCVCYYRKQKEHLSIKRKKTLWIIGKKRHNLLRISHRITSVSMFSIIHIHIHLNGVASTYTFDISNISFFMQSVRHRGERFVIFFLYFFLLNLSFIHFPWQKTKI